MKKLDLQKRMASQLLKTGQKKVWIDPEKLADVKEGITKADIRVFIQKKWIKKKTVQGQSKSRSKKTRAQKKKGRQTSQGSRKGAKKARTPKKKKWMQKIRVQRKFLQNLKQKQMLESKDYRNLYLKAKAGFFRNKAHLKLYAEKFIKKVKIIGKK